MTQLRISLIAPLCLALALPGVTACNDDEVIADYTCGDGVCSSKEDIASCPEDCGPPCGDDLCEPEENAVSCPADCAGPLYPGPCFGGAEAFGVGILGPDYDFDYEMVNGGLRITHTSNVVLRYTFDPDGNLIAWELDYEDDGVMDWVETRLYDADGRCVGGETRSSDWSEVLTLTTHEYDATGFLSRTTTESLDAEGDPVELLVDILYEWNAAHTFCVEHVTDNNPGNSDYTNEITYDATGNVTHRFNGNNGTECDFTYDQEHLDVVAPGTLILIPWDDIKKRARLTEYRCLDDPHDFGEKFYYDEHGNMTRSEHYWHETQPEPTHTITYDYSCWE
ncbi:MAG: hypothetical protein ABI333_17775 [bacterium]